jgi:hypothetical protein
MSVQQVDRRNLDLTYRLNIGDELRLEASLLGADMVFYAGMIDKERFSLLFTKQTLFFNHAMGNLYYPTYRAQIRVAHHRLNVIEVEQDHIVLKYLGIES